MAIGTVEFDLSMVNPNTGEYLTARAYTVEGVTNADGSPRLLSIGQLVMAICLQRASDIENAIITKMSEMELTSLQLEIMTAIESKIIEWPNMSPEPHNGYEHLYHDADKISAPGSEYNGKTMEEFLRAMGVIGEGIECVRFKGNPDPNDIMYDDFIKALESKMDEKNSFSQQSMIELQSLTNKRDQSYDMVSNILKSLNTVLVGNANNM